jgi:hypothetical protein
LTATEYLQRIWRKATAPAVTEGEETRIEISPAEWVMILGATLLTAIILSG